MVETSVTFFVNTDHVILDMKVMELPAQIAIYVIPIMADVMLMQHVPISQELVDVNVTMVTLAMELIVLEVLIQPIL